MSKTTPEFTTFSVYCQARAVTSQGREYPTSMCGNDARLLYAAMLGIEDAVRFRHADTAYPTEAAILASVKKAFSESTSADDLSFRLAQAETTNRLNGEELSRLRGREAELEKYLGGVDMATLRVASVVDLPPKRIRLVWDYADETEERRIVDVTIGGRFRPTRALWQEIIDAGLPMCSYEEASESWDVDIEREQK